MTRSPRTALTAWLRRLRLRLYLARHRRRGRRDGLTKLGTWKPLARRWRQVADLGPGACVLLDVDGLIYFNDRYGHVAGDEALIRVADVVRDLAPAKSAFRVGGDEFVVLLGGTDSAQALSLAETLRGRIAQANADRPLARAQLPPDRTDPRLTASIAVVCWGRARPPDLDQVLHVADELLDAPIWNQVLSARLE